MTENSNEQEYIKDPNQLDMFAGILFTPEQEQMIADFIKKREEIAIIAEKQNAQNEQLIINIGFVKDVDFVNTFKVETVTREMTFGYTYNNTDFKAEATFKQSTGGIYLKGKRFDSYSKPNELVDYMFDISFLGNKINCYTVQDNFRFIKPSTILEKLKTYNLRQERLFEEFKKKTDLKQSVIEKYTKLYPNATITVKTEHSRYSGYFDIVEVKFESGSYVQFRLIVSTNTEYIHSKFDAELDRFTSDELLEKFSKQVKKEGSN
jgi:hypothetical protein